MMGFLNYFSLFVTLSGTIITAVGAFLKTSKKKMILVFIGIIIAFIGTCLTKVNSYKFETEITRLNNFILSSITGGSSYCRLSLLNINSDTNNGLMGVEHKGNYPLYDVHFRIVDVGKIERLKENYTLEYMLKNEINIDVGNISPSNYRILGKINLGSGDERKYNIFIVARNGFFMQQMWLKRINGAWVTATKMTKGKKEIEKKNDPSFPTKDNGEVDWGLYRKAMQKS